MNKAVCNAIENYLQQQHDAREIVVNDGDCDLVAEDLADAIDGISDPDQIKAAIETECYAQAEAGMLGHPQIHPILADIVLNSLASNT